MSNVVIDICIDNDAFADRECGNELSRILRTLADQIEWDRAEDLKAMPLIDLNGNRVGSFEVFVDSAEDPGEAEYLSRNEDYWSYVKQMTREDLVSTLENACSIQCYDHETAHQLRHALVQCLHSGDTDLDSLRHFFGDKYR